MSPDHEGDFGELSPGLIDRYLAGQCTPDERAQVEAWVRAHPDESTGLVRLRDALSQGRARPSVPDVHRVMAGIRARRGERAAEGSPTREATSDSVGTERMALVSALVRVPLGRLSGETRSVAWRRWVPAVAAALIVAGVTGVWGARWGSARIMPVREFATLAGTRSVVTLRDGTTLTLGPATRVRVPAGFGIRSRVVELDGEGVFAVVHDATRPFVVRTARGDVRDVGTTFVVRAYGEDSTARIAVAEGEVAVGGTSLHAHDAAAIDRVGRMTVRRGVDVTTEFGWSTGVLVFADTPLREVARELERTYALTVAIEDSVIAGKLVTATFTDETVDEVLSTVTRVVGARFARTGKMVVIRRGVVPAGAGGSGAQGALRTAALGLGRVR